LEGLYNLRGEASGKMGAVDSSSPTWVPRVTIMYVPENKFLETPKFFFYLKDWWLTLNDS
jgi:hypothetical protein